MAPAPSVAEIGIHIMRLVRDRCVANRSELEAALKRDFPHADETIQAALASVARHVDKQFPPTASDTLQLRVGGVYRAKRPAATGSIFSALVNDRQIMWMNSEMVQYDSPSVADGRHYPKVKIEAFLKWAKEEITLPKDEWAKWDDFYRAKAGAQAA